MIVDSSPVTGRPYVSYFKNYACKQNNHIQFPLSIDNY